MMKGKTADGLLAANQFMAGAGDRQMKQKLAQMQIENYASQIEQRRLETQREQEAAQRKQSMMEAIPGLFQAPGMTGGAPVPQTEGGIPMFSKPMGVTPMKATPGGFDVQGALRLQMDPETIQKYAGLANLGRPKATRQMEVDDGRGGKRIALVDDFGQEVAGFAGYTAPVQVNQGDRVTFAKPTPGASFPMNMSPDARASNAVAWANHGLSKQRLAMEQSGMVADSGGPSQFGLVKQFGKPPAGYRWRNDGSMEAVPGGPADIKAGELGAKAAARADSAVAQADSVLQEVRDAKGLVGWNTAGVGGAMAVLPATDARNLSAKLLTIKANLGFDRLQQMRDQSPTGGALGQVAVQELASLQATVASLDQMQDPEQLGKALDKIERHYAKWRDVVRQSQSGKGGASGGWGIQKVN
jgi:hypothetical protein